MNRIDRKRKRSIGERFLAFLLAFLLIVESSGTQFKAVSAADSADNSINLETYLTDDSTMYITVYTDGVKHSYTPAELTEKGLVVPKGAPVKVELYFDTIYNVKKGQTLTFQLPENLMNYSGANEQGIVWNDVVWEENNAGADVEAADWVIDKNGLLTVTIRDDFFEENKHTDDTIDLFEFNIQFSGSLSTERGEHSGNDDNVISFRGETSGTGNLSFTIPFEYLNENANVEVQKTLTNFDPTTRTVSYTIQVTAPEDNIYTATNVKVTDEIQGEGKDYVEQLVKDGKKYTYRDCVASTGDFNAQTGIWTVGSMTPGQTETLTYNVVLNQTKYKSGALNYIDNVATVNFNNDGVHTTYASLKLPNTVLNKEAVQVVSPDDPKVKSYTASDDDGTYRVYKLTVTAKDGAESNIRVEDSFSNPNLIKKIVAVTDDTTVGTVEIDDTNKTLVWKINYLAKNAVATLTYKAYLNEDAWQTGNPSSETDRVTYAQRQYESQEIKNTAKLYVGGGTSEVAMPSDAAVTTNTLEKNWVKKGGSKINDSENPKNGLVEFTIEVNGDPVSDKVATIYDTLKSGGTYEDGGVLTVKRYTSSNKFKLVDTKEIPLSEIVSADGTGQRWDLNLADYGLQGAYFYVLTYYVKSSSVTITNNAGIGFGVGKGYGVGIQITGGGGMTYGTDYSKSPSADNKQEAYTPWTVTVKNNIPLGAVYVDRLSAAYVYQHEQFWFDDACLDDIEIKFEGKTLVQGVDYAVEGVRSDDTGWANKTDPDGLRYSVFQITFNNEYAASSSNPLTINYKVRINTESKDQGYSYSDGCSRLSYNYCKWLLPDNGKLVATNEGANYDRSYYDWDIPLKKSNGTYNADKGTITWTLTINSNTTIDGDAVIEEYLPVGLTCDLSDSDSVKLSHRVDDVTNGRFSTTLGKVTQETYTDSNGKTGVKLIIPLKGLVAYYVQSSRFSETDPQYHVGPYTGWSYAGEVTVTITTKVTDEYLMNMTSEETFTNKAVLTGNDCLPAGGVSATGTVTVPNPKLIDKSMVGNETPIYVEYALNINPNSTTLSTDGKLQVVDIMGTGMSLATDHNNCFKVYNVAGVSDLLDSNGNVIVANAQKGTDITSQCTIEDVTGQELDGLADEDKDKPLYLITVPDATHVVIIYWASFEAVEDEKTDVSNKASFFYENKVQSAGGSGSSNQIAAASSSASVYTGAYFFLKKTDQMGNVVEGVTYELYEVTMDSSGNEKRELVMTTTTGADGKVYFGHKNTDANKELMKNTLYCLIETSAPVGYTVNSKPYYLEFQTSGHDTVDHPDGVTVHKFFNGGTYSFTNKFTPASYKVPVKKTINGKTISSDVAFTFNLTQLTGDTVYTDENYSKAITANGITATINGSGDTAFDALYFTKTGTYTFTLSENDLSDDATKKGYTKDNNTYEVTVVVGENADKQLEITSATYKSAAGASTDMTTSAPVFDNKLHLDGTVTLKLTKVVENRNKAVQAGEFAFTVSVGGKVISETNDAGETVKKKFYTDADGNIEITLDIDQDDIGTQTYVISEVEGVDPTIKYSTEKIRVKVTIAEAGDGKVAATNIDYPNGNIFTNGYIASGSATLTATKKLLSEDGKNKPSMYDGEFDFVVKEGKSTVATGTNKSDGSITFSEITYDASDIGTTHTYVISEVKGSNNYITYTEKTVTAKVKVTDAGNGKLTTTVTYDEGATEGKAVFTNYSAFTVPTGISIDVKPYLVVLAIVAVAGVTLITVRRKSKKHNG
jgi:pilin isopeptide linkage protein